MKESEDTVIYLGKGQKLIVKNHFGTELGIIENGDEE